MSIFLYNCGWPEPSNTGNRVNCLHPSLLTVLSPPFSLCYYTLPIDFPFLRFWLPLSSVGKLSSNAMLKTITVFFPHYTTIPVLADCLCPLTYCFIQSSTSFPPMNFGIHITCFLSGTMSYFCMIFIDNCLS